MHFAQPISAHRAGDPVRVAGMSDRLLANANM